MELDEKTFGDARTYFTSDLKAQAAVEYIHTYDETGTAVLSHIKSSAEEGDGKEQKKPRGSCLICLAFKEHDIKEHTKHCNKMFALPTTCSICLAECTDAHLYSHTHAATLEKFNLILKNGGKVGLAKSGALVIDLVGENIARTEKVYDIEDRIKRTRKTSPGGLAAYYLKTSIISASSNKSDAKKLSENSAIVQTLLQVCLACSAGQIPCVAAAKIAYTLNGYSIVELIGALAQEYPKHYAYQFADRKCMLHNRNERTIVFTDSLTAYNHTIKLLRVLTGRDIPAMVPIVGPSPPAEPAKAEEKMDTTNQTTAMQTASANTVWGEKSPRRK